MAIAAGGTTARLNVFNQSYRYSVTPISDNKPFFWHFATFNDVITNFTTPLNANQEVATGERVLLLLLGVTVLLGIIFLLLPFLYVKKTWLSLRRKGTAALFFGAIGLGFIFFEITLIQLLTLFLGYPTYALTVTLCSILIFVGIGALLSSRWKNRVRLAPWLLLIAIAGLTIFYLFGLVPTTNALLHLPMAARVPIAFGLIAPLGLCLGMFMPLGLTAVASLGSAPRIRRMGLGRQWLRDSGGIGASHHAGHDLRVWECSHCGLGSLRDRRLFIGRSTASGRRGHIGR